MTKQRCFTERGQASAIVLAVLGSLVLLAVLVGGYQLGWWFKGNAVNRTAAINRTSYEVQQTYREKARDDITDVRNIDVDISRISVGSSEIPVLRAQRIATVTQTCDAISRLTTSGAGIDPDIQTFNEQECAQ